MIVALCLESLCPESLSRRAHARRPGFIHAADGDASRVFSFRQRPAGLE